MQANCWGDETDYDYAALVGGLNQFLRLKATPIGMKRFQTVEEMEQIPRLRRPDPAEKLATDQVVGQSRWLGWTIGITMENLMGEQCGTVVGSTMGRTMGSNSLSSHFTSRHGRNTSMYIHSTTLR